MAAVSIDPTSIRGLSAVSASFDFLGLSTGNFLFAKVNILQNAGSGTVSAVTFAGEALTPIQATSANNLYTWAGYLLAPPVGEFTLAVTISGSPVTAVGSSVSASNVNTVAPFNGAASVYSETGTASSDTFNITTTRDGCVILGNVHTNSNGIDFSVSGSGWTALLSGSGDVNYSERFHYLDAPRGANAPSYTFTQGVRNYTSVGVILAPKLTGIFPPI